MFRAPQWWPESGLADNTSSVFFYIYIKIGMNDK